jgi:peptidoglycan/LPS O-acetylase OafA/YrhL
LLGLGNRQEIRVTLAQLERTNETRPAPHTENRLRSLDGLRLLAAASVMMFHFTARENAGWGQATVAAFPHVSIVTRFGNFGVELFFLISGFVILMTAWDRPLHHFAASRVARLYPAYWVAVLATGALVMAWHGFAFGDVLSNLTMLQSGSHTPLVSGVYWTLWVELRFYLLIAVFVLMGITRQRVLLVAAVWPSVGLLAEGMNNWLVDRLLLPEYAPFFAAGMVLYVLHRDGHIRGAWLVLTLDWALSVRSAIVHVAPSAQSRTGDWYPASIVVFVITLIFVVMAVCTLTRVAHLGGARLSAFGALTYPLYLMHQEWGNWVINVGHDRLGRSTTLLAAVGLSVVLAYAVHRWVERPVGPRLRKILVREMSPTTARSER